MLSNWAVLLAQLVSIQKTSPRLKSSRLVSPPVTDFISFSTQCRASTKLDGKSTEHITGSELLYFSIPIPA
jgi:hypothetical protein